MICEQNDRYVVEYYAVDIFKSIFLGCRISIPIAQKSIPNRQLTISHKWLR